MATFMQLITCGTLFYATEFWGNYDTGVTHSVGRYDTDVTRRVELFDLLI